MGTKTISIMDDVYDMLLSIKTSEESFSDEIRRLISTKEGIMDLAGAWKDISEDDAKAMKEAIKRLRGGTRLKEVINQS